MNCRQKQGELSVQGAERVKREEHEDMEDITKERKRRQTSQGEYSRECERGKVMLLLKEKNEETEREGKK